METNRKPLLIYLPGMEGTGKLFYRQKPQLASRFNVVSVPLRSDPPFDYEDLITDVRNTIDREGATKAIIVGESFGGTIALQFALKHQDRIEQLVLVNTFPYYSPRFRLRLGMALLGLGFSRFGRLVREFSYSTALKHENVPKEDAIKLFECSFSHGYPATRLRMHLIRDLDLRERLPEIHIPVVLIASRRDKIVPSIREAEYMASRMLNARILKLPGHGHTPLISPTFSLADVLKE